MREVVAWALSFVITLMFMVVGGNIYLKIRNVLSKRPHKSDDEEGNPITKFKDDLAEIYEDNPNGKLKKLAQAVWNRVEEIEKWHDTEIKDIERRYYSATCDSEELKERCNKYNKELGEWYARYDNLKKRFAESEKCLNHSLEREANLRKANEGLNKLLKEEQEKNKIPIFSDQTEVPSYLISENTFGGQINPFAKVILNTKPGEPMTATEATELAERLQNMTSKPIVMDSETLNEPTIKNEEFIKQLRDWWGLEASKAVELPNSIKKYVSADQLRQEYAWILALYKNPNNVPLRRFKVRVAGTYNDGKDSLLTDWILPATSINEIRNVLGEDGIRVLGGEELPI